MRVTALFVVRAITLVLFMSAVSFAQDAKTPKFTPLPPQLLGDAAPRFFTLGVDNETEFNSEDLKEAVKKNGAKRVVLSFFATWCEKCAAEFEILKNNADILKKNKVQVYLIDVGESIIDKGALVEGFVKKYAGSAFFPVYFDPNSNTLKKFGLVGNDEKKYALPIIVVLDDKLKVLAVFKETGSDFPQVLWGPL